MENHESFVGRSKILSDRPDGNRFSRLAATLDHLTPLGSPQSVPPLGHWLCFLPDEAQSSLGLDGHPAKTDNSLISNVKLPRRMWAGSRIRFFKDISLDTPLERMSTLKSATTKSGRSGEMLFVTMEHRIKSEKGEIAIIEEQDLVYKEAASPGSAFVRSASDPGESDPSIRMVIPDPVLLFRYSALTFNAHRIHYDHEYATNEEGYPGLVVQGPLIATLMLYHLLHQVTSRLVSFSFRATSPSFEGEPITLGYKQIGDGVQLRALGSSGVLMTGEAELEP